MVKNQPTKSYILYILHFLGIPYFISKKRLITHKKESLSTIGKLSFLCVIRAKKQYESNAKKKAIYLSKIVNFRNLLPPI